MNHYTLGMAGWSRLWEPFDVVLREMTASRRTDVGIWTVQKGYTDMQHVVDPPRPWYNVVVVFRTKEDSVSRSRYKRRSNRSARILVTLFSVLIVLSTLLSLVGPHLLQDSDEQLPPPTFIFPTQPPPPTSTPLRTPTAGVPTPVLVTPTASP
jgi:hypothetical protein